MERVIPWESCEVVKSFSNGYEIHYAPQVNLNYHWRLKDPDGYFNYFHTENDLWQYILLIMKAQKNPKTEKTEKTERKLKEWL